VSQNIIKFSYNLDRALAISFTAGALAGKDNNRKERNLQRASLPLSAL
jgi:hypothetical protein